MPKIDIFLCDPGQNTIITKNSSYLSHLDTGSAHIIVRIITACVLVTTSHLNTIVLDPLFLLKYVTAYLAMHLLQRTKEKDKPCMPVDASYFCGIVVSQPVTPEERR